MDCSGNKENECYNNEYAGVDCRIKNYYELLYEKYCEPHPASLFDTEEPLLYDPPVRATWLGQDLTGFNMHMNIDDLKWEGKH